MKILMEKVEPASAYRMMIQTIVPRPVAWTLTRSTAGIFNLAPFSYFNAICSDPPLIMLSIGWRADRTLKDTRANIKETGRFNVHIASEDMAEAVTKTSLAFPPETSELDEAKLEVIDEFGEGQLPRLRAAGVAFRCELYDYQEIGNNQQGLIFGEIKEAYIDDSLVTSTDKSLAGDPVVDAAKLKPIARLGGDDYATIGRIITVKRPPYSPH